MGSGAIPLAVVLVAAVAVAHAAALQCAEVTQLMTPCMPFLTAPPPMTPYALCCNSITMLNQLASTAAERVAVCNCLKGAAVAFPAVDFSSANGLPRMCGVALNFTISPTIDCTKLTLVP